VLCAINACPTKPPLELAGFRRFERTAIYSTPVLDLRRDLPPSDAATMALSRYTDRLTEEYWKRLFRPSRPKHLSWNLDRSALSEVSVVWPAEYMWKPAAKWFDQIAAALSRFVSVERREISQPAGVVLAADFKWGKRSAPIFFDIADSSRVDKIKPTNALLYFKMQHAVEGYKDKNVLPGGYLPNSSDIYSFLGHLRKRKDHCPPLFDVYGRFGTGFATEVRTAALRLLRDQEKFRFEGGARRLRYYRFLSELARASICIDLPGNGPFCFRLVDYFAIGSCVVAVKHEARLHVELEDFEHLAYVSPTVDHIVQTCELLLTKPNLMRDMVAASRDFFERYLHGEQLAAYYLSQILEEMS